MAGRGRGPLLLSSGGLTAEVRQYLTSAKPTSGYIIGNLDENAVKAIFGQSSH